jgi:hypothetical protein
MRCTIVTVMVLHIFHFPLYEIKCFDLTVHKIKLSVNASVIILPFCISSLIMV